MEQTKIDVTKCIGCRKGISLFIEDNGVYTHMDLFATREAGASYKCENSEVIGKYLVKNGDRGTFLPNEELKELLGKQELWWEEIVTLAYESLKEQKEVSAFFNEGEVGKKTWNLPNIEIENKLLAIAVEKGIEINQDNYPYLLKWEN